MSYGKIRANFIEHNSAGSVPTEYVVEGTVKAKVAADPAASIYSNSSINITSGVDEGTGDYKYNLTNNLARNVAQEYCSGTAMGNSACVRIKTAESSTSVMDIESMNSSFSTVDAAHAMGCWGDLA
ncbi:MAG: hypothetical protein CMO44_11025 [Verrucomicrobiales bacterium]|nr:hypothetical protein [Verrucomicrobiales bacterium]